MSEPTSRPISPPDATTAPFWEATARGQLVLQRCRDCASVQHPPRERCIGCDGEIEWIASSGRGRIDSFTIVHRAPHPAFDPPYVVARVALDEGVVFLTNVVGADEAALACDRRVRLDWLPLDDERALPVFRLEGT